MEIEISVNELMELFLDTIQKCGMDLLNKSDEDIEYNIFEELDISIISFLQQDNLLKLKNEQLISEEIALKSAELRNKFIALQNTDLWNVESVKKSKEWKCVFAISDEIKSLLEAKNG